MLLAHAHVFDNQRVSILAVTTKDIAVDDATVSNLNTKNEEYVKNIKYELVASVLRQCTNPNRSLRAHRSALTSGGYGNPTTPHRHRDGGRPRNGNNGSQPLSVQNFLFPCRRCGKFGHWQKDHRKDGSLRHGAVSSDKPIVRAAQSTGTTLSSVTRNQQQSKNQINQAQNDESNSQQPAIEFISTLSSLSAATSVRIDDCCDSVGPLVDPGAPFSDIGCVEFEIIRHRLIAPNPTIELQPEHLSMYDSWQYECRAHASARRKILGSVCILVRSDAGRIMPILHLVIDGSSQWILGRKKTSPVVVALILSRRMSLNLHLSILLMRYRCLTLNITVMYQWIV